MKAVGTMVIIKNEIGIAPALTQFEIFVAFTSHAGKPRKYPLAFPIDPYSRRSRRGIKSNRKAFQYFLTQYKDIKKE